MNIQPNGILDFEVYPLKENMLSEGHGKNGKGLFVACAGPEEPATAELLAKMLLAARFDMAEDALVLWMPSQQVFSFSALRNETGFSNALFFGIAPKQAGLMLNAKPYVPLSLGNVNYLFSTSLADILANPALKRPLWEGMKAMFGV
jgi:hypothetical protein